VTTNTDPVKEAITEARRAQILDAAGEVFAEKGFHSATIRDVARAAGVADGTIYNYFKNKNDLLIAMVNRLGEISQFAQYIEQLAGEASPEQLLTFILDNRTELLDRNRTKVQALMPQIISDAELRSHFYHSLARPTLAVIERGWQAQIDQGHIRPVDPKLLVRLLLGSFLGLVLLDMIGDPVIAENHEHVSGALRDLLLNGILPRAGEDDGEGA
jgi:TetR/AcrR family fatty acid metabolism transcriptional regulator